MNDTLTVAIGKFFEKKIKEITLIPGVHNVDETVILKIKGNINKGDDVDYTPTADIPLLATLAVVLEKSGFQRENIKNILIESMTEAILLNEKGEDHVKERCRDIDAAMAHVRQITTALPKKTKSGATRCNIQVEQLVLEPA